MQRSTGGGYLDDVIDPYLADAEEKEEGVEEGRDMEREQEDWLYGREEEIEEEMRGGGDNRQARKVIIHDCFAGHLAMSVMGHMSRRGLGCVTVPRKMTGTAQIADTVIFRKFKADLDHWIATRLTRLGLDWGKLKADEWRDLIVEGVCACWYDFPSYLIRRGAVATGIDTALDGTQDHLVDMKTSSGT
jgi:hypothetical protein